MEEARQMAQTTEKENDSCQNVSKALQRGQIGTKSDLYRGRAFSLASCLTIWKSTAMHSYASAKV